MSKLMSLVFLLPRHAARAVGLSSKDLESSGKRDTLRLVRRRRSKGLIDKSTVAKLTTDD